MYTEAEQLLEDSSDFHKSLEKVIQAKESDDFRRICSFITILISVGAAITTALILLYSGL